jgi:hypothetical protein
VEQVVGAVQTLLTHESGFSVPGSREQQGDAAEQPAPSALQVATSQVQGVVALGEPQETLLTSVPPSATQSVV